MKLEVCERQVSLLLDCLKLGALEYGSLARIARQGSGVPGSMVDAGRDAQHINGYEQKQLEVKVLIERLRVLSASPHVVSDDIQSCSAVVLPFPAARPLNPGDEG
ncbi:hypothetical protein KGY14_09270 [Ameyamaea chiangmaiensis]|uniref:Uncharacterized protein n=1 Tax=Ameyamaea chiangmaiensis TaxID=442969 RepID=A0A850PB08_9PROT|nr:hypothetical protein [Ameyamaea chiangmaiensis]MBS4075380.1 hypothetical protein [Ameyamaea chiangmaiensis]NVN39869.1 hypothetical protein [Ameyamaea chiangmaiensis]